MTEHSGMFSISSPIPPGSRVIIQDPFQKYGVKLYRVCEERTSMNLDTNSFQYDTVTRNLQQVI